MRNHEIKGFIPIKVLSWLLLALAMLVVIVILLLSWWVIANPDRW